MLFNWGNPYYIINFLLQSFGKTVIALSANLTKWSNLLKQFFAKMPTNCWSVFDHFVWLALKGLTMKALRKKL